jgi:hypothetical protein
MSKLPKTVKVLHKTYTLEKRDNDTEILHHGSYGNHYPTLVKIEYTEHEQASENVDTIVHELNHAILHVLNIKLKDEESFVTLYSTGLVTVMKDNIKLFEQLLEMLKE